MKKSINIIFSINDSYAPYLYVCLKSLLAHVKSCDKYKAYILYTELSECHQKNLLNLQTDNLKIEFINVESIVNNHKDNFSLNAHFTIETYYRFFLPQIFPNLDKVLYLDADTMIMKDISPLFNIDINGYYLGVTHDCEIVRASNFIGTKYSNYFIKTLNVDLSNYFQAGVMLVNLKKMREDNITDKLLDALERIGSPKFVDQDILNIVCQSKVKFIPQNWDYTWHLPLVDKNYLDNLPQTFREDYENARKFPYIVHFTGNETKPTDYPNLPEAKLFFEYAQKSPYYSQIKNKLEISNNKKLKRISILQRKIKKYRLLNMITFGILRKKYNKKITVRINEIEKIKNYLIY